MYLYFHVCTFVFMYSYFIACICPYCHLYLNWRSYSYLHLLTILFNIFSCLYSCPLMLVNLYSFVLFSSWPDLTWPPRFWKHFSLIPAPWVPTNVKRLAPAIHPHLPKSVRQCPQKVSQWGVGVVVSAHLGACALLQALRASGRRAVKLGFLPDCHPHQRPALTCFNQSVTPWTAVMVDQTCSFAPVPCLCKVRLKGSTVFLPT